MYIAIEGVKGTGKSTVIDQLVAQLHADKVDFQLFCPTRPMPAHVWWEQAKGRFMDDPQFVADLYTARANYHASQVDFNAPLILGDRSILTSLVTRWPEQKEQVMPYVQKVTQQEYSVPKPDVVCYLDAPLEIISHRLANRERDYGKFDETLEKLQSAKKAYDEIFVKKEAIDMSNMEIVKINANHHINVVFKELYFCVKHYINFIA